MRNEGRDPGGTLAVEEGRRVLGGVLEVTGENGGDEAHGLVVFCVVTNHDHLLHVGKMGLWLQNTVGEEREEGIPCVLYTRETDLRSKRIHQ